MTGTSEHNLSTEHQAEGDARRPQDTKPEAVEDRPSVSTVEPEDYPKDRPDG